MNTHSIYQNANVISVSMSGGVNRVAISYDEYEFLTHKIGIDNCYKGHGDDFVELDYHNEFIPLIRKVEGAQ